MTNSATTHPSRIPGYDGGPFTHRPELLAQPLFWLGHLYSCAAEAEAEELLLGADEEAAAEGQRRLLEGDEWPVFTVPLRGGHRLYVVYRAAPDDPGVDYLLHHPHWERAELLAQDEGHFMGPALSWPELCAAADNGLPGGSTSDPGARLLLLLPALGDEAVPDEAAGRVAAALRACTAVEAPEALAAALLDAQGPAGAARWSTAGGVGRVSDGPYSYRNPDNHFALPPARLARVSAALDGVGST
ncbi:hypothetical protein [Streptomyces sp. JB150]|uniref:hypothetical protein n=1 Tax=Streptomyces sp. JB150 TaxID=2714844 RepID=UPI001F11012A|nr:hypothetical protein [Streptomyces sp. JB150]